MISVLTETQIKILFEQYYIPLVEFSWHIVKCQDVALDIVQDTFCENIGKEGRTSPPKQSLQGRIRQLLKRTETLARKLH